MNKHLFKLFYCDAAITLCFSLIAILLSSCTSQITGKAIEQIPNEITKIPEVYFCPREDCGKIYEENIASANTSVYCAFYDINLKNIISSLAKKSKTADVKVVIDGSNNKNQIKGDGLRYNNPKYGQLMHNKFCVFDENTIITGSFNPTINDNKLNNNNIIVVYSKTLAKNYEDEFNELWNGQFGKGKNVEYQKLYINEMYIENYFCPEDKCASRIINLINKAEKSIYFMTFSFTSEEIADAILKKKDLDIKGIFDSQQSSSKFSQFKRISEFGVNVKTDRNRNKMHHKVFIIDNQTVVTGSFNPTLSADTKNDENLLIVHNKEIANAFLTEFESLWK